MKLLESIQRQLEETYGAFTGLNVSDFVRKGQNVPGQGTLVVKRDESDDLDVALVLDRDIFAAWESGQNSEEKSAHSNYANSFSVAFEEVSHFVYLCFNHNRRRNITSLEMELQSEIDRVLLAYHGGFDLNVQAKEEVLKNVLNRPYPNNRYEEARRFAAQLLTGLSGGDPSAWTPNEFKILRQFFHSDLAEKIDMSR